MRKIGSQTRETLEESGYHFVGYLGKGEDTILLQANDDSSQQEIWGMNNDHAGYTIEFNGVGFEFLRDYCEV